MAIAFHLRLYLHDMLYPWNRGSDHLKELLNYSIRPVVLDNLSGEFRLIQRIASNGYPALVQNNNILYSPQGTARSSILSVAGIDKEG